MPIRLEADQAGVTGNAGHSPGDLHDFMVRDQEFLCWRFDRCPNREYTRYIAERGGEIVGYMVTREIRWGGYGRGRIVDYLVRPDDSGALSSLLGRVIRDFRSRGVVSVIGSIYTTRKNQVQAFRQHGFLYSKPGPQMCVDRSSLQQTFAAIEDWFFTFADGDIGESRLDILIPGWKSIFRSFQ